MKLLGDWPQALARARDVQAESRTLVPTRLSLPEASSKILVARTATEGRKILEALQCTPFAAMALDSEYTFDRPGIELRSGKTWREIRSQRPICVSIAAWAFEATSPEESYVLRAVLDVRDPGIVEVLAEILRLRFTFVFHNVKAELFTFWQLGLDPDLYNFYDTYLAAAALNLGLHHKRAHAGRPGRNEAEQIRDGKDQTEKRVHLLSLVGQCGHYQLGYPFSGSKDELREVFLNFDRNDVLGPREIEYAAADVEWTLRLYVSQQLDIVRHGITSHMHDVEFPFAIANARMEWRGVLVEGSRRDEVREASRRACEHYAAELRRVGIDPPGSRDQFLRLMAGAGHAEHFRRSGKPCVEDGLLELIEDLHPAVRPFRLHRRNRRLAAEEWLSGCLTGADGRTHPTHHQLGAATGRNTSTSPNLVGIGRVLRPVVTAPPGRAIVELDYGQIEVGVAAAEHGDPNLIAAYNSGDVYSAMAQRFYAQRLTADERLLPAQNFKAARPDLREAMKTFVLAVIYNIQAPALAARFGINRAEAERERQRFLDLYPILKRMLEESVVFGAVRGFATCVSGVRRRVECRGKPDSWTRNVLRNTPIQGSAAVVFKRAVVLLDRAFRNTEVWLVLPVHDAIVIECPVDQVEEVGSRASQIMKDALRAYYPQLHPKVELNCSHPKCWNKDGHADSLDRFLADPTFRIENRATSDASPQVPDLSASDGTLFFTPDNENSVSHDSALEEQLRATLGEGSTDADLDRWRETYAERAAIQEYDGELSRPEAERAARTATIALVQAFVEHEVATALTESNS